ncbi:hypothetical protein RCL_jg3944.t1 [Rhizophagus clarus]|uniref:Uncharacterized protein n=1 Tax=Rhizophagus clarus TaxID=94130 RepID=A0A8H3KSP4_9GLOM|nr:hypothetical protein RCL_jg3944.t1 [Rhizophagus clarus]
MLAKSNPVLNNNTDAIDFSEVYRQFKLKLEKHTEKYKKKKLQEKKLFTESDRFKDKVVSLYISYLANCGLNCLYCYLLQIAASLSKGKIRRQCNERAMDSLFIKKLLNLVLGPYSRENNKDSIDVFLLQIKIAEKPSGRGY